MSLPSSMADFVPCDRLLQKAYCHLSAKLANKQIKDKVDISENKNQQVSKLSINTHVSGVLPFFSVKILGISEKSLCDLFVQTEEG